MTSKNEITKTILSRIIPDATAEEAATVYFIAILTIEKIITIDQSEVRSTHTHTLTRKMIEGFQLSITAAAEAAAAAASSPIAISSSSHRHHSAAAATATAEV